MSAFPIGSLPERRARRSFQRGLSLIELMIAMLLGLLVVGSAVGAFLSNQRTYRATESLSRVQENARAAFELMAREVREAGGNVCSNGVPIVNVLSVGSTWWSDLGNGVVGYENGALAGTAAGTDAIDLLSATNGGVVIDTASNPNAANLKVNTSDHGFETGDILIVCDYTQGSIFQVTGNPSSMTIGHNTGGGNCTKGLGVPLICDGGNGTPKSYAPNSVVAKLEAARWFVADNGRGGRSLYRVAMDKGNPAGQSEEIAEGVQDMQIEYLLNGSVNYVPAAAGLDWSQVVAAKIALQVEGPGREGTDGQALQRDIEHVVNLRNRTL